MTIFLKSGCAGLSRKLVSPEMMTLGNSSTADRACPTQASPTALLDGGGGSTCQSAGRLLRGTFSMSASSNWMRMATSNERIHQARLRRLPVRIALNQRGGISAARRLHGNERGVEPTPATRFAWQRLQVHAAQAGVCTRLEHANQDSRDDSSATQHASK